MPERAVAAAEVVELERAVVAVALEEGAEQVPAGEPVPGPAAVMGLGPAQVRVQGLVLVRVQPLRSALDPMRPSVPALVPPLVPAPPEALDWAPVPVHPLAPARAGLSDMEPATAPVTGPGTRAPGLKTEPVSGRLRNVRQERVKEQGGTGSVTLCSLI